ncbi:hypothetical protein C0993_001275, partial [Termitomyces sp. T159_Od127]
VPFCKTLWSVSRNYLLSSRPHSFHSILVTKARRNNTCLYMSSSGSFHLRISKNGPTSTFPDEISYHHSNEAWRSAASSLSLYGARSRLPETLQMVLLHR